MAGRVITVEKTRKLFEKMGDRSGLIIRVPSDWSGRFLGFLRFLSFVCQIIERALIDRVHIMVTHFCFFGGLHFLSSPLPNFGERAVNIRLGAVRVQGS